MKINYIDYKFTMMLSSRLDRFKDQGNHRFNFRCPICGDSHADKKKSRGYIFTSKKDSGGFYCHNCGSSMSLGNLLKQVAPDLYSEYKIESFSLRTGSVKKEVEPVERFKTPETSKFKDVLGKCHKLSHCPESLGDVLRYVEKRKIPTSLYPELFATDSVMNLTSRVDKYKEQKFPNFPALVIPFYDEEGEYSFVQCRAASDDVDPRYRFVTLQITDGIKMYGANHVNWSEPVYVLEGPIDAMFIDNGVATAGAAAGLHNVVSKVSTPKSVCMMFDNDYKTNSEIMNHINQSVMSGFSVVLYDRRFDGIKDVNDAIRYHGWTREEVNDYIRTRTFHGLRAKAELSPLTRRR